MTDQINIDELELSALLCSRVCHDLVSPIGAITNGLEVLEDDADEQMRGFAMDLIKKSATQASASLQFARLAFGASGSAGAVLETNELERVTVESIGGEKIEIEWQSPVGMIEKDVGRLLLNLVLIAQQAIPRGGKLSVGVAGPLETPSLEIRCEGVGARIPPAAIELISGAAPDGTIDARAVQPYFAGLLARSTGLSVTLEMAGEDVVIAAASRSD